MFKDILSLTLFVLQCIKCITISKGVPTPEWVELMITILEMTICLFGILSNIFPFLG